MFDDEAKKWNVYTHCILQHFTVERVDESCLLENNNRE